MNGWKPIESAPKGDGEIGPWILLYVPRGMEGLDGETVTVGSYYREDYRDDKGRFKGGGWVGGEWDGMLTPGLEPTHWQPLPEPPDRQG